jgi:hypothetical protein
MPAPPLTHHEILELIEPFTRRGRQVDMAATQRIERRIVFRPADRGAELPAAPALHETLQLEDAANGGYKLTRLLGWTGGPQAALSVQGPRPAELLAQVETVAPAQQFRFGAGHAIARSYEIVLAAGAAANGAPAAGLVLRQAVVQLEGLSLTFTVPAARRVAAEIDLVAAPGTALDLPEDLLAVLGWDWARLVRKREGWNSRLRLRGTADRRTHTAEAALEQVAAHLVRVFSEAPARFHERHVLARWGVVGRRAIPTVTALGMIVGAAMMPRQALGAGAVMGLMHYGSIALLVLSFCLQELPRFEIPPLPRRSRAMRWGMAPKLAGTDTPPAALSRG